MSISINNSNQVIIPDLGQGVQWDGGEVQGGNYGEILTVSTGENGQLLVQTSNGTLSFAMDSPVLAEANETFSDYELSQSTFENFNGFNWLEIAALVLEANELRKKTSREIRQEARDNVMSKAKAAADEIRKGALTNMIMGVVSGGISIAGGVFSLGQSMKAMGQVKAAQQDVKMSQTETRMASTQKELLQVKSDIATKQQAIRGMPEGPAKIKAEVEVQSLQLKEQKLMARREMEVQKLDSQIDETHSDLETARSDLDATRTKLQNDPNPAQKKILTAKEARLEQKVSLLEAKQSRLQQIKVESQKFDAVQQNVGPDADPQAYQNKLDEANTWADGSQTRLTQSQSNLNDQTNMMQSRVQVATAVNALVGSAAQLLQTTGSFVESTAQADAKILDAEGQQASFAADDATQDWQNANEAIQNFKQAWEKFLDTIKQTQDRLVQA